MRELLLPLPCDFHVHVRDDDILRAVLPYHSRHFGSALIMGNVPWIGTAAALTAYRGRILTVARDHVHSHFEPRMVLSLDDSGGNLTTPATIDAAADVHAVACKLYPRGATTGTKHRGVAQPTADAMLRVYEAMVRRGLILCIHCEDPLAPRLEREEAYLSVVSEIRREFPELKVVIEHVSSRAGMEYVLGGGPGIAATVTLHHLTQTIDDALENVHNLSNPVLKYPSDRAFLRDIVQSGHPRFFFGSDSAPHRVGKKHCAVPACGCFTAPHLLPWLAHSFEQLGCLERLADFVSRFGCAFYDVFYDDEPVVRLVREDHTVPAPTGIGDLVVWPGPDTYWRMADD
jgi:dihydroorotase